MKDESKIFTTSQDLKQNNDIMIISLPVLIPEIGNNLRAKDLDIFKVAFSPESNDKVICSRFDKAL